jgi:hypothetical protein
MSSFPPVPPGRPPRSPRRVRLLVLSTGLAALAVLGRTVLLGASPGFAELSATFVLAAFGLLLLGSLMQRVRGLWHLHLRELLARLGAALWSWTGKVWPRREAEAEARPAMGAGDRIALIAGLALCVLDVALTTLLLRDVFPEPPYRFELMGWLSPAAAEWSFYVVVALFKTLLELWFGVFDKIRSAVAGPSAMRWFVLGGASAFDAALAAARGLLLAEQGMGGSAVTVSNIVFVGFGVAVPWVAAHTGGLLVGGDGRVLGAARAAALAGRAAAHAPACGAVAGGRGGVLADRCDDRGARVVGAGVGLARRRGGDDPRSRRR